jgi:SET domain
MVSIASSTANKSSPTSASSSFFNRIVRKVTIQGLVLVLAAGFFLLIKDNIGSSSTITFSESSSSSSSSTTTIANPINSQDQRITTITTPSYLRSNQKDCNETIRRQNTAVIERRSYSHEQCRYYLGESAIPKGGLGLYTVIDLKEGDEAQSMGDICIYVADTPSGTHFASHSWARDVFIGQFEGYHPRAACEGFGTLFNTMPDVPVGVRTSVLVSMHHHTNGGLHRFRNPGAGAITHYYGISSKAARNVQAGSELTINYGDWSYDEDTEYIAPVRDVEWIQQHGMCIDNIVIGQAKADSEMGRSAFARYDIAEGTVVAPAPIQMFPNRSVFATQEPEALFVNYCFQPEGSDMLLFPYGPGVNLINHANDRSQINVRVEWSTHYMSHNQWLNLPLDQYWVMDYPGGLIMDIVATRDIQQGEELFMDYGTKWDSAWKEHVANWKPITGKAETKEYTYVDEIDRSQPFRTVDEQKSNPYPYNLKTVCWTPNWEREDNTRMEWVRPQAPLEYPEGMLYCNIIKRTKKDNMTKIIEPNKIGFNTSIPDEYFYEVSLLFDRLDPDVDDKLLYIDFNVPHSAISFVDKPYLSDLHLPNSFRHPIGLPDYMMPKLWHTTTGSTN